MEPLDPAKNDDSSGFSRRRISSILKAPRKSIRSSDPEQQENVVECAKPVEKRNSRRVSFAPANNVLLFSNDAKNASPARSPLQDLMTTSAATQNRVQVVLTEDGIQQITGMETLLSGPLHASQQREKVNFDTVGDFGEKTVMFSTDDAFMDMTHSQTINIANDADVSLQNDVFPSSREKTVMFTADDGSMDMTLSRTVNITDTLASVSTSRNKDISAEIRSISSSVPCLDPGFENFLASLFKSSGPSVNPAVTGTLPAGASSGQTHSSLAQTKAQNADVDKENQAPGVMEKSLNTSRKTGESSHGSAVYPMDDVSMDMTEAQTGHILGLADDDDPFQCVFPIQEMYSHLDSRVSQTAGKTKQQKSGKTLASFNLKDATSLKNPSLHAHDQRHKVSLEPKDECREKTMMFTADDEFMDMTQSHTVNIDNASSLQERKRETCGPPASSADGLDQGFKNFLAGLCKTSAPSGHPETAILVRPPAVSFEENVNTNSSLSHLRTDVGKENRTLNTTASFGKSFNGGAICPENDVSMDMTESQTGRIVGLGGSDDPFQILFPMNTNPRCESLKAAEITQRQQNNEGLGSHNSAGMETSLKPSLKTKVQRHEVTADAEDHCRERTVRFSADEACMDVTRSHTVNIVRDLEMRSDRNMDFLPACGEKTVRFTANDAAMDVTRSHTVNIVSDLKLNSRQNVDFLPACGEKTVRFTANDAAMDVTQSHTVNIATGFDPRSQQNVDFLPGCGEKTLRFTANDAAMDVTRSHTVNIVSDLKLNSHQNVDSLPTNGEKTVRFTANDAAMDVTRSHTVNIATGFDPQSQQNVDFLPGCGEKTLRFAANDAAMDVTRSHTVNIATGFDPQSQQKLDVLPAYGEKTLRFTTNDAAMDVTRSHTVNIVSDLKLNSHQNVDSLPTNGEKTVRFTANDAAMDVTQSHTVNIATGFDPQSQQNVDFLPGCGEKTLRFAANDAAIDVTRSHTVNIVSDSVSSHEDVDFPLSVKKTERPSSGHSTNPGFRSQTSGPWVNPMIIRAAPAASSPQKTNGFRDKLKTEQKSDVDSDKEAPDFASAATENPVNKTMAECPEDDARMDLTAPQTDHILGQTRTDEPLQCPSATEASYPDSDHLNKSEEPSPRSSGTLASSGSDGVEITNRTDHLGSNETDDRKEPKQTNQPSPPNASDHVDAVPSRKSRRMSLADIHSKLRRLSTMINTDPVAMGSCTAPLPQLEHDVDNDSKDKTKTPSDTQPELEEGVVNTEENTQAQCLTKEEQPPATTPFNLKTQQLMSRLSVGGFKAKLPRRSKADDPKKVAEHTKTITVNVTSQLSNFDADVSDIYDEELGSCEDMSEMLDTRSPQRATEKVSRPQELCMDGSLNDDVFEEDLISAVQGKKRLLPADENNMEDEKRMKGSPDFETPHLVECDGNIPAAPCMTTQTIDDSNNFHTANIRHEATFESTFKQSLFESQLEDYASDMQRKFDDGSITVLEFFKVFNIDFVIHNPRQSVLPDRLLSDTDHTPMDLLKDKHISRPKQMVYETNVLNLTEKVEGLKERMRDLDRPLKIVNRSLWEEMTKSSEKELRSFGAKLKERNNLFRKTSKVQSHEMKEVLYSNLVQANQEEQQKLRRTIEEADEMIKSLDDCIHELETELAAVEQKGCEEKPSLKSLQEEMKKITEALAENDRQTAELEMQKKQNSKQVNRLKAETRNLENHVTMLHMVNEWKFKENRDNRTIYTFLHETFQLQVVYEKSNGNDADNPSERKITDITFEQQLDEVTSQGHACLVHKLLSQYIEGEAAWAERYPTGRHVPKLLHDVGLVVSRCRLLGEELRLLEMWGGLKLDILNISCVDTLVHIVFSSLKKLSKFEVVFSVSLTNHLCVLRVQSFENMIGSTAIQQIEEIVASFSPGKNLLTKIVKKIHENLLC